MKAGAVCAGAPRRYPERRQTMRNLTEKTDVRREQLEALAAEGDQEAVAELWQVYGVDRRAVLSC